MGIVIDMDHIDDTANKVSQLNNNFSSLCNSVSSLSSGSDADIAALTSRIQAILQQIQTQQSNLQSIIAGYSDRVRAVTTALMNEGVPPSDIKELEDEIEEFAYSEEAEENPISSWMIRYKIDEEFKNQVDDYLEKNEMPAIWETEEGRKKYFGQEGPLPEFFEDLSFQEQVDIFKLALQKGNIPEFEFDFPDKEKELYDEIQLNKQEHYSLYTVLLAAYQYIYSHDIYNRSHNFLDEDEGKISLELSQKIFDYQETYEKCNNEENSMSYIKFFQGLYEEIGDEGFSIIFNETSQVWADYSSTPDREIDFSLLSNWEEYSLSLMESYLVYDKSIREYDNFMDKRKEAYEFFIKNSKTYKLFEQNIDEFYEYLTEDIIASLETQIQDAIANGNSYETKYTYVDEYGNICSKKLDSIDKMILYATVDYDENTQIISFNGKKIDISVFPDLNYYFSVDMNDELKEIFKEDISNAIMTSAGIGNDEILLCTNERIDSLIEMLYGEKEAMELFSLAEVDLLDIKDGDEILNYKALDGTLHYYNLNNLRASRLFGEGLIDGTFNSFEGIVDFFFADGMPTRLEYKQMFILQILESNNHLGSNWEDGEKMWDSIAYTYGRAVGGVLPAATLGLNHLGPVAKLWTFLSLTGNKREQITQSGYDSNDIKTWLAAIITGGSEVLLGSVFGAIPGLGRLADKNINLLCKAVFEGGQEFVQYFIDVAADCIVTGEELLCEVSITEAGMSFILGTMVGGTFNLDQLIVDVGGVYSIFKLSDYRDILDSKALVSNIDYRNSIIEVSTFLKNKQYEKALNFLTKEVQIFEQDGDYDMVALLTETIEKISKYENDSDDPFIDISDIGKNASTENEKSEMAKDFFYEENNEQQDENIEINKLGNDYDEQTNEIDRTDITTTNKIKNVSEKIDENKIDIFIKAGEENSVEINKQENISNQQISEENESNFVIKAKDNIKSVLKVVFDEISKNLKIGSVDLLKIEMNIEDKMSIYDYNDVKIDWQKHIVGTNINFDTFCLDVFGKTKNQLDGNELKLINAVEKEVSQLKKLGIRFLVSEKYGILSEKVYVATFNALQPVVGLINDKLRDKIEERIDILFEDFGNILIEGEMTSEKIEKIIAGYIRDIYELCEVEDD